MVCLASASQDGVKEDASDVPKPANKAPAPAYNEPQPSDDDDFPDEQEIFKANGFMKLQKTLSGPVSSLVSTDSVSHVVLLTGDSRGRFRAGFRLGIVRKRWMSFSVQETSCSSSASIRGSDTFISTCHRRSDCAFRHDSSTRSTSTEQRLSIQWTRAQCRRTPSTE